MIGLGIAAACKYQKWDYFVTILLWNQSCSIMLLPSKMGRAGGLGKLKHLFLWNFELSHWVIALSLLESSLPSPKRFGGFLLHGKIEHSALSNHSGVWCAKSLLPFLHPYTKQDGACSNWGLFSRPVGHIRYLSCFCMDQFSKLKNLQKGQRHLRWLHSLHNSRKAIQCLYIIVILIHYICMMQTWKQTWKWE